MINLTKKTKIEISLDNGNKAKFPEGTTKEEIGKYEAVVSGWDVGSNPHFGVSRGLIYAIAKQREENEDLYLGKLGDTNILDSKKVVEDILNTYIETHNLDVPTVRVSASATTKKLAAVGSVIKAMIESDPEVAALLKEKYPEEFAKI